jgi:2-iminoacetate synthase ThiH
LKAAGLDALPGGGAEVMSDRVHEDLFAAKPMRRAGSNWRVQRIAAA